MTLNLIFLGPPGAGKGTIAQNVGEKHSIPQISTGDLLRAMAKEDTELGKKVKEKMEAGLLVEDELMAQILEERIKKEDCANGFILDGYPRTMNQAELLEGIMERLQRKIDAVLNIEISDESIIERLSNRVQCSKCGKIYNLKSIPPWEEGICDNCGGKLFQREDDKPEVIKNRLEVYRKQTAPLIEYYKGKGLLRTMNSVGEVADNIRNAEKALQDLLG